MKEVNVKFKMKQLFIDQHEMIEVKVTKKIDGILPK
jgi:hypothetical protein